MQIQEKFKSKLFVEGNDDQHIIWAICQQFSIAETFDVKDCLGRDKLLQLVPKVIPLMDSDMKLGIVVDADTNISTRWQSLSDILQNSGYQLPNQFNRDGLILESPKRPKIGIWLMPNNQDNGMVEDFLNHLVPAGDVLLQEARNVLSNLENKQIHRYNTSFHHSKALIHTWLAWQEDPGTPMGLAITKTYLTTNTELCNRFVSWLNRLFNE